MKQPRAQVASSNFGVSIKDDVTLGELWDREYSQLKVIPSSTRLAPSKAVVLFSELLRFSDMNRALDLGSGIGRNAVYLAKKGCVVDAVDISEAALVHVRDLADDQGVSDKVQVHKRRLEDEFPFPDETFDLVLDSYVFCHFTIERLKEHFRSEVRRVLRPGGRLISSVFSTEDAYYRQFFDNDSDASNVVTDFNNGITKQLYTEPEIKAFFRSELLLEYFVKFEFEDVVLGQPYVRSILTSVLKR